MEKALLLAAPHLKTVHMTSYLRKQTVQSLALNAQSVFILGINNLRELKGEVMCKHLHFLTN